MTRIDMIDPETSAAYRSPLMRGERATVARSVRRDIAADARALRGARSPEIARFVDERDEGGVLCWHHVEPITAHAIDGVDDGDLIFGPRAARTPRGLAADHFRRLMILDLAADQIINTAREGDIGGPAWHREVSYHAAFLAERRRRFAQLDAYQRAADLAAGLPMHSPAPVAR